LGKILYIFSTGINLNRIPNKQYTKPATTLPMATAVYPPIVNAAITGATNAPELDRNIGDYILVIIR
jgi:hypothetical protein